MNRSIFYLRFIVVLGSFLYFPTVIFGQHTAAEKQVTSVLHKRVLKEAQWAMDQEPVTVTATVATRSTGGPHDFFSEGDYWWPDPSNPGGPYVQRDGETNPDNFVAHRQAMIRFSKIIGALASAYKITHEVRYVRQAMKHLNAWFANPETRMNPNLLYAQAIQGRFTGRGIGIIDTIHLIEVAQGMMILQSDGAFPKDLQDKVHDWFASYLGWLTSHRYGIDEMEAENNHGTCWVLQVASFAKLVNDSARMEFCRNRYKSILLPNQMAKDGSFPLELKRTKPYGYSLFNLDAMVMICQILSTPEDNLWDFSLDDGRTIKNGVEFMIPFVSDKKTWPYSKDVMYWDSWPVAQPSLVFSASVFGNNKWLQLWSQLEHFPTEEEVVRNLPVRNPLIWF